MKNSKNKLMAEVVALGLKKKVTLQKAKKQAKKRDLKLQKEKQRLDKAVQNHTELNLINTALAESRKVITLDSGVKVEIKAGDKSIFIIDPNGDKIRLPSGSYDYKQKVIVVDPEATIKEIKVKPVDKVNEAINKLKKYM